VRLVLPVATRRREGRAARTCVLLWRHLLLETRQAPKVFTVSLARRPQADREGEEEDVEDELLDLDIDLDADAVGAQEGRKMYGMQEYLEGILWNVQMYVDGFVPDYRFVYPFRYAPDARRIVKWIEEHDFDPDPAPVLPLSTAPALTPLQACVSMMPRGSGEFLPAPLRPLVDAPDSPLAEMLGDDRNARLDIELLVQLVEQVDLAGVPQRDKVAAPSANLTHLLCKEC